MKEKYKLYVADLIKQKKMELGINSKELSERSNVSKSYLSKIENGSYLGSMETINFIFNVFDIEFYYEGEKFEELSELMDEYIINQIKANDTKAIIEKIISYHENAVYSALAEKYYLCRFINSVLMKDEFEYWDKEFNRISKLIVIDSKIKHIYLDFKGVLHKNNNDYQNAIKYLIEAKNLGKFEYTSSMVSYHLSYTYGKINNLLDAYRLAVEARDSFNKESNWKREWYTECHIANLFSRSGEFQIANKMYLDLIQRYDEVGSVLMKNTVKVNLMWNYMKQLKWSEALQILEKTEENEFDMFKISYFHCAYCYFKLNQFELMNLWIEKGLSLKLDNDTRTLLEMLRILSDNLIDEDERIKKLLKCKKNNEDCIELETLIIINNEIRNYAETNFKYKIAYEVTKELLTTKATFVV